MLLPAIFFASTAFALSLSAPVWSRSELKIGLDPAPSAWFQPQYMGSGVVYVVVNPPN